MVADDPIAAVHAYFDGLNAHRLEAIVAAFTSNSTVMLPDAPTASGAPAIRDLYRERLERFDYGRVLHVDDLDRHGDLAVARCHTTGQFTLRASRATVEAVSRELFTLVRTADGGRGIGWGIKHYMANQPVALPH